VTLRDFWSTNYAVKLVDIYSFGQIVIGLILLILLKKKIIHDYRYTNKQARASSI